MGFELLETLRALPMLTPKGVVVGNSESVPPLSVSLGKEAYPGLDEVRAKAEACAAKAFFAPCKTLAAQAGNLQSANTVLLGAACALEFLPIGVDALERAIKKYLKPKIVDCNLRALALGAQSATGA